MIAIRIRTLGYSALVLAAATLAGCGKQEGETAAPPTAENAPASATPAPAPETTPATSAMPPGSTPEADKGVVPAPAPSPDMPPKIEAPQPSPAPKEDEKKADADASLSSDELAEIKKLPAGEAELALKQQVCPVSGEHLGAMGTPLKVTAAGQTFYLCCKGCSKEVASDPAAAVAKLKK